MASETWNSVDGHLQSINDVLVNPETRSYPFESPLGDRQSILDDFLHKFDEGGSKVVWLIGPPLSGKSVMAHRFMRMLLSQKRLAAAFLFPDAGVPDIRRETILQVLKRQMIDNIPGYSEATNQPSDSAESAESVFEPLGEIRSIAQEPPRILVLDNINRSVWKVVKDIAESFALPSNAHLPLKLFVTSSPDNYRRDSHLGLPAASPISMVDLSLEIPSLVRDSLYRLKESHPFRSDLPSDWPPAQELQTLVERALSSALYASVAVDYVSNIHFHPHIRLTRLCEAPSNYGMVPSLALTPGNSHYSLYALISEEVAKGAPATGSYLQYLFIYHEHRRRDPLSSVTSNQLFINVLATPEDEFVVWVQKMRPLLFTTGNGDRQLRLDAVACGHLADVKLKITTLPATVSRLMRKEHQDLAAGCLASLGRRGERCSQTIMNQLTVWMF